MDRLTATHGCYSDVWTLARAGDNEPTPDAPMPCYPLASGVL
jgi:hypothetical protein